jgi:hypothetical protein
LASGAAVEVSDGRMFSALHAAGLDWRPYAYVAIVAGAYALQQVVRQIRARNADAEADRLDRLRARADEQHAWVHASDLREIYSEFHAAPM